MRTCKKCGKPGHFAKTCGKEKVILTPKGTRQCGKCMSYGHNARTCGQPRAAVLPPPKTMTEIGHEILTAKAPRIPIDGTKPQKGLWIVNPDRKRCAGLISYVKRTGEVVWRDFYGVFTESSQRTFSESGYKYAEDKPVGEDWRYLQLSGWETNSELRNSISTMPEGIVS